MIPGLPHAWVEYACGCRFPVDGLGGSVADYCPACEAQRLAEERLAADLDRVLDAALALTPDQRAVLEQAVLKSGGAL